ncbi:lactoylglutathione lyase [Actibacterium sp. 188UL27-1]|uniref:lactoylglutathione lyase n=1 Tax=Actibacterium sp. 188UL27-1 TaxID=2786961 RepID=UPI001956969C|nr:lactoylglutathione lyase [Actibacterium sp. 188UL27-1]MBM7067007.1 lactoylglutathione lyase [Actibacterium sp. 188UL27-1]
MDNAPIPNRILYTMLRVRDLDRSLKFYQDALGMYEMRRETFPEGKFTLVFIGYGDAASDAVIELTYNWDDNDYELGNAYGHIALEVDDIYAMEKHLKSLGVHVVRPAGPMTFAPEETGVKEVISFIEDPDGYRIEFIEKMAP